jgi:hypothetical protein
LKKSYLLIIIICLSQSIFSQPKKIQTSWHAFISVGYGNAISSNVSDYYNNLAEDIRFYGVPIETQTKFGRTLITNAEIFYAVLDMRIGISLGYLYSPAYSNYSDAGGTLKLNGSIKTFDLGLKVRGIPTKIGSFSIIIDGQVGVCHTSVNVNEEVRFVDYSQSNYDWKMLKDGWGPSFQGMIGTSIDFNFLNIIVEGGYRYSLVKVNEQSEESAKGIQKVNKEMNIGPCGPVFLVSLGIKL